MRVSAKIRNAHHLDGGGGMAAAAGVGETNMKKRMK